MPANNGLNREEKALEADRLLAERGRSLTNWLKDQKLDFADENHRPHWGVIVSHFKKLDRLTTVQAWIDDQAHKMVDIWGVTKRFRVATEICRRFVEVKMNKHTAGEVTRAIVLADSGELDLLPEHLKWVFLHPGLKGLSDDPVRVAEGAVYERENPAPNHGAINQFKQCREDDKYAQKLLDEVNKILLEHRKRSKEQPVSEQDQKEVARVLDMKAELAKMQART